MIDLIIADLSKIVDEVGYCGLIANMLLFVAQDERTKIKNRTSIVRVVLLKFLICAIEIVYIVE